MTFLPKWANAIEKVIKPVAKGGVYVAMASLLIMVCLLVVDVITRNLFRVAIPGTKELEEYLLVLVTFLGLSFAGLTKAHISVDLVMNKFPSWVQHVVATVTGSMSLLLWSLISWRTFVWGLSIAPTGLSSEALDIPRYPFVYIAAFGSLVFCFILITEILRSVDGAITEGGKKALWILPGLAFVGSVIIVALGIRLPFSDVAVGLLGIIFMVILLFSRMPIAFAMGFVGLIGAWYFKGFDIGVTRLDTTPYLSAAQYIFIIIPFFFLMGTFCFHARISRDLYESAYAWLGRLPGGLASATIGGCAGFAAVCGDSLATAAAMGTVALPEMRRYKYDNSLATGCIAAGGTLGILIPPSMGFIFYALITETSVATLFIAGIIPGICLASLFILLITVRSRINPKLGPPGPSTTWKQKFVALRGTWAMLVLFLLVMGGIYLGIFTVIEAGAIGAAGALVLVFIKRRFTLDTFRYAVMDTARISSVLLIILIGVMILGYFFSISKLPIDLAAWISALEVHRYIILALILLVYVVLGMLMNIIPMILVTLPVFWPTIAVLGFDPIWFGVIMVVMMEMGQITPPIGMNVFVIAGVAKDVPVGAIYKGIVPFVFVEVIFLVILTAFPQIALWLPSMM